MPRLPGTPQGLFWMSTVTVIPDFFTKGPHHGNVWDRQKSRDPCQRHSGGRLLHGSMTGQTLHRLMPNRAVINIALQEWRRLNSRAPHRASNFRPHRMTANVHRNPGTSPSYSLSLLGVRTSLSILPVARFGPCLYTNQGKDR